MSQLPSDSAPMRLQAPVYSAAAYSNSIADIVPIAIPLWLAGLGVEPFMMGIVIGARYIGPLLFSIHGGAVMDRLGTRRVMTFFAAISTVVPLLYPHAGWIPAAIALQLVGGLADSLGWSGSQTLTNQVFRGNAVYSGRMIAATRLGTLAGPIVGGFAWEWMGPQGGFLAMAVWGGGTLISVLLVPATAVPRSAAEKGGIRAVLPRPADYLETLRSLAVPVIASIMAITSIRQLGSSIQNSFYTVYLEQIGISEAIIGLLIAMNGLAGIAAIWTGRLTAMFNETRLLFITVALSIISIAIIPLFQDLFSLFLLSAIRGFTLAVSVALMLAMLARYAGEFRQGRVIGLRMTCHQVMNVVVPVMIGAIAQQFGIGLSFYLLGGVSLLLLVLTAWLGKRAGLT